LKILSVILFRDPKSGEFDPEIAYRYRKPPEILHTKKAQSYQKPLVTS
jgi:hypothetical protein